MCSLTPDPNQPLLSGGLCLRGMKMEQRGLLSRCLQEVHGGEHQSCMSACAQYSSTAVLIVMVTASWRAWSVRLLSISHVADVVLGVLWYFNLVLGSISADFGVIMDYYWS